MMATWFRRGRGTALGILVGALTGRHCRTVNALGGLDGTSSRDLGTDLAEGSRSRY
jgi:hypothetical protein